MLPDGGFAVVNLPSAASSGVFRVDHDGEVSKINVLGATRRDHVDELAGALVMEGYNMEPDEVLMPSRQVRARYNVSDMGL